MKEVEPIRDLNAINQIKDNFLKQKEFRNWLMFSLGLSFAMRISDLLKIKISDLYDEQMRPKEKYVFKEQKTNKTNIKYIQNGSRAALIKYTNLVNLKYSNDFLFSSRKGKNQHINRVQAYKILSNAAKQVGLKSIGTHSMRKSFGYHAFKTYGIGLDSVMLVLNHNNLKDTKRYIGLNSDLIREIEAKVSF